MTMSGLRTTRTRMVSPRHALDPTSSQIIGLTDSAAAEDYYAADYPDEEVDSEDEYNRAAYQYRNGNASDLEEFDEREDEIALDHGGEKDGEPGPFSARFNARSPAAFRGS